MKVYCMRNRLKSSFFFCSNIYRVSLDKIMRWSTFRKIDFIVYDNIEKIFCSSIEMDILSLNCLLELFWVLCVNDLEFSIKLKSFIWIWKLILVQKIEFLFKKTTFCLALYNDRLIKHWNKLSHKVQTHI